MSDPFAVDCACGELYSLDNHTVCPNCFGWPTHYRRNKMRDYRLAEVAYEGYRNQSGGKSLISGQPIPAFEKLPDDIQDAWAAAADAVVADCIARFPKAS